MGRQRALERTIGLLGATGIGVSAIVGGGILALAGVALATTGPGAIVAFALNGAIALITALSFAEMSAAFPESGGTYAFAKKVLSIRAAFLVGWVVWLASTVAAVLYALGFAAFAAMALDRLVPLILGVGAPPWIRTHQTEVFLAVGATCVYAVSMVRGSGRGRQWESVGKLAVFAIIILGGLWAVTEQPWSETADRFVPFFSGGIGGLAQAMGYTFIALQGFDLIAAVAGEVRDPGRNIPRAMLVSLGVALAVYLPLLFVLTAAGVPAGGRITEAAARDVEGVVAIAVQNFLGPAGFWMVTIAAILSMLSALSANLMAASRVASVMASDRALPELLGEVDERTGAPVAAISATVFMVVAVLAVIPDIAVAGAVASLVFLISFALAHWTALLARLRHGEHEMPFRTPWFPAIPVAGMIACVALAVFQGVAVPSAGVVAMVWLLLGGALFLGLFGQRARVVDASAEALDPALAHLRGHNPLVLVPIANPSEAAGLVALANAMAPRKSGRVLMLSVVSPPDEWKPGEFPPQLVDAQAVLGEVLTASFAARFAPEALTTIAPGPWPEIARVARTHRCESVLLGMGRLDEATVEGPLLQLVVDADADVLLLRAPSGWSPRDARRILVPVGGQRDHSTLRARLLGSLSRDGGVEVRYLGVLPPDLPAAQERRLRRELMRLAEDEVGGQVVVQVERAADVASHIVQRAADHDLTVLGVSRGARTTRLFGQVTQGVVAGTESPLLIISRRA